MSAEASRGQALSSQEVLDRLREAYPKAFTVPPTPLQIGVRKAIRRNDGLADISNVMFTRAMRRWVRQDAYLQAICDRVPRVDLDGQPWGEVSDDAVAVATKVLRMRKKKQERWRRKREKKALAAKATRGPESGSKTHPSLVQPMPVSAKGEFEERHEGLGLRASSRSPSLLPSEKPMASDL